MSAALYRHADMATLDFVIGFQLGWDSVKRDSAVLDHEHDVR
jgi:hypothetical protein